MRRVEPRGWAVLLGTVAVIAVIAGAALLGLRGGGLPPASLAASPTIAIATPSGTGFVAKLPVDGLATFSWSPDGAHLLVAGGNQYTSRVYDRFGALVSTYGSIEGWLDATHLIDGSGYVADIGTDHTGGPTANSWVVASGHGAAAIIVAVPACVGDPLIDWYRDGKYVKTRQQATPYGWSADGKLAVIGHFACSSEDALLHGWKGSVDVVDFATGKVIATLPDVRGEMAFSPDGADFAAQSDADLEIADLDTGDVQRIPGVRFLGWLDQESLYAAAGSQVEFVDLDPVGVDAAPNDLWQAASPTGLHLQGDTTGAAVAILAADGTKLLDLSSGGLVAERYPATGDHVISALQQQWWSPDGRMLALASADGRSVVMFSIDPTKLATSGQGLNGGMINGASLPPSSIAPVDPGFTGGPPQQPNMGTKPPTEATSQSVSSK
jgi:WD40 repeat protein